MARLALLVALALALAGCGSSQTGGEPRAPGAAPAADAAASEPGAEAGEPAAPPAAPTASSASRDAEPVAPQASSAVVVWVTRDAGEVLLESAEVEPGLTAIQAVSLAAEIETRYAGRYVSEIAGISSDLDGQHDWFFLINGIEPDVGGAEVKVEAGDVVWWDYRSWQDSAAHPAAAVGAFPRPFWRGWKGSVRPVEVVAPAQLEALGAELEAFLVSAEPDDAAVEPHRFELVVDESAEGAHLSASMGSRNGSPVTFVLRGSERAVTAAVVALIEEPELIAHRYEASFDERGEVVGR